jgi:hypothetical protein
VEEIHKFTGIFFRKMNLTQSRMADKSFAASFLGSFTGEGHGLIRERNALKERLGFTSFG